MAAAAAGGVNAGTGAGAGSEKRSGVVVLGEADAEDPLLQTCRICGEASGELVRVCACRSVVHVVCQEAWQAARAEALTATGVELGMCEVCRTRLAPVLRTPLGAALVTVEGCALILLCALAVAAHLLYVGAVRRTRRGTGSTLVWALATRNALATALLAALACRASAHMLRERYRPPTTVVVALAAILSCAAAGVVFALAGARAR